nr:hypothetical protein [Roseovarius nitratireducens]
MRIRAALGRKPRLLGPAFKSEGHAGVCAYRFVEAGGRLCKRRKTKNPGPARCLVCNFAERFEIRLVTPDPAQVRFKIRAKHVQTGQRARIPEDGAGFLERIRILDSFCRLLDQIAFRHAVPSAFIRHPFLNMKAAPMKYPKYCIPVKATLENGSQHFGGVHVTQSQRVLDVLCDDRPFIPFSLRDCTILLNKSKLVQVDILKMAEILEMQDILPELNLDYLRANSW